MICGELDAEVAQFRTRPLSEATYPYVWLDATYVWLDATYVKARTGESRGKRWECYWAQLPDWPARGVGLGCRAQ